MNYRIQLENRDGIKREFTDQWNEVVNMVRHWGKKKFQNHSHPISIIYNIEYGLCGPKSIERSYLFPI